MLSGILIGNMTIATFLSVGGMLPSIIFAIIGARYCGRHGNKESIVVWARNCIFANLAMILFFTVTWYTVGTQSIASLGITMILYIVLTLVCNGFMMIGTTAGTAFMADVIDYELDRSGKYIPAVVSGTYSLIDKIVSSFSALIATGCVALIGYTSTLPQPGDSPTNAIFWVTMFLSRGLAILGWLCTLWAMRRCRLDKAEMVEVQKQAAGYDGLELNQFMIHSSSLMVRMMTRAAGMPTGNGGKLDWHGLLRESGLSVASLHTDLGSLEREPEAVCAEAKSFGTDTVVITGMYRFDYSDETAVRELAARLNRAGEALKSQGVSLLYHNHNVELLPVRRGIRAYDILVDETDEASVNFEFDSYWFTDGGADAKAWMHRLGSRMKLWHINDRGSRRTGPAMTQILAADSMELRTGNMDLDGLWQIAAENGVDRVVLESYKNWVDKDPVKSLQLSAKWLKKYS